MTSVLTFAKIAMRNLFSKPVTTKYPFEPATYPEGSRGHIELNLEQCVFCGMCARKCPTGAIQVDRKTGNWTIARFDCVQCANCVNGCPKKCLTIVPGYFAPGTEKVSETFHKDLPQPKPRPAAAKGKAAPGAAAAPATAEGGKPKADPEKCKFCGLCARKCPNECITVDRKEKSWSVRAEDCVGCGVCQSVCHFEAIQLGK